MTEEDPPFDYRKIPERMSNKIESKQIRNPYAEKYMEDKTRVVIKDNTTEMLRQVKDKRKFNSDNDTVKFLCDLEKELTNMHMIQEFAICEDCGKETFIENIEKIHNKIDSSTNCFGCFQKKYRIKTEQSGTKEAKTKEVSEVIQNTKEANEIIRYANREEETKEPRKKKSLTIEDIENMSYIELHKISEEEINTMPNEVFDAYNDKTNQSNI